MKTYLFIHEVEIDDKELIIKVEPLYCADSQYNLLTVNDKDYTPTKGDKLYFLPGVNIPRVKLKDLSLQYGVKTVRDIDQATHVFCGKHTTDKLVNSHWYYKLPTETFKAILNDPETFMDDYYRENLEQALEFYTEPVILMKHDSAAKLRNAELHCIQRHVQGNVLRGSDHYYTVDDDYTNLFPKILSLDLFNESKLLKHINGDDAATIDETMFLQISDMFNSSDQDNHIIAMEIMANCNYMESLLFIEMLFKEFYNQMSNCHTKNHVNFKSLISFLNKNKNYMSTTIDEVVHSLISKNAIDLDKINIIMKYYGEEIADRGGTQYFEIKSVTLSEELSKLLNTNYVHQTFPDFISEDAVEIPEIHGDLADLSSLENNIPEVTEVVNDIEISDEDIETAFTRIERNELKSELIELEEAFPVSESELNEKGTLGTLEDELNNNQIKEEDDNGFEWF
jgi:hypothetical protein